MELDRAIRLQNIMWDSVRCLEGQRTLRDRGVGWRRRMGKIFWAFFPMDKLWQPPSLRQSSPHEERRATWLELFFDLVFVATIAELG